MVFERGYGMANLEQKVPITPATIFDPASIAKPFTALSIMLLAEQGKLSLDDEVWKHVPEWVDRQDRVTIRHLLAHTAGLRDAFLLIELAPPPAPGVDINEHILRTLAGQRGLNFAPSTEFSYNNGGYNVLGSIVARVSGQSFREFAAAHILRPLGMTQSSFRGGPVAISPHHALGYHRDDRGFHLARDGGIDTSAIVGNSGLFTTVGDLLRFAQNFGDARVGSRDHLDAMQTAASLGENGTSPWGLGLEVGVDGGLKTVGHGGGDRGIAAYVIRYPAHDLNVAVLCNLDNLNTRVGTLARQVAALYLPARSQPASPRCGSGHRWTGADECRAREQRRPVSRSGDRHLRSRVRAGRQAVGVAGCRRRPRRQRRVPSYRHEPVLHSWIAGRGGVRGTRRGTCAPDPGHGRGTEAVRVGAGGRRLCADGRRNCGSTPADTPTPISTSRIPVVARASGLVLQIPGRAEIALQPVFPDAFYGSLVDLIKFSRGAGTAGDRLHHQPDHRPQSALRARSVVTPSVLRRSPR